jgi:hypothetical protein
MFLFKNMYKHVFCTRKYLESYVFWDITTYSPLKVNERFRAICCLHFQREALLATCFVLLFCFAYSSTLKIEVTCSSETSVYLQRTTWRHIPEDRTIHNHRCENFKSCKRDYLCQKFSFLNRSILNIRTEKNKQYLYSDRYCKLERQLNQQNKDDYSAMNIHTMFST